jgi:hypothetical protein
VLSTLSRRLILSSARETLSAMEFPDPGNLYSWDDPENSENDFGPTPVEVIRISVSGVRFQDYAKLGSLVLKTPLADGI